MKYIKSLLLLILVAYLFLGTAYLAVAQQDEAPKSLTVKTDTIIQKPSKDGKLNADIKYNAEDSIRIDRKNGVIYLYGKARVIYTDFELDADFIRLDQKNNTVFAKGMYDSQAGRYRGRPIFKQGSEAPITTDSLIFNVKTKKGKSYGVFSEVDGGYLTARQFKKNQYDEGFFKNGIYSTCNLDHPHFGVFITRGIVTKNQIITGPAFLEIEDIPFPAGIPFGFFPKPNKRASGILFPSFGEDGTRGFFMRDLGYYIGLNDYWDMTLRGSLYSRGSYETSLAARYQKKYKYDGNLNLRYSSTRTGIEGTPGYKPFKDFNIQWSHYQRPEANPGTTFSASVNAGTSSYFTNTAAGGTYNLDQLTRNTLSSSIAYGRTFADGLFNFSSSLSHRQDMQQKTISLELPSFSLNMSTLNPFDSKKRIGEQKWYQKINVGYSLRGTNSIDTKENLLFQPGSFKNFRNGFQHAIPVGISLNLLKVFNLSSGIQYTENWYTQTIRKNYSAAQNKVLIDTVSGFRRSYEYSVGSSLTTKFYGQVNFKKGKLMAIRHVVTPSIGFNYRPDFSSSRFGFYKEYQQNAQGDMALYSIFEQGVYGSPGRGKSASIGFSLDNNLEAKVKSKGDTTGKTEKIPILQGLSFSGSYNFVAESFKLSTIGFSGRTALFKQLLGVSFFGTLDPYQLNSSGERIDKYLFSDGKLARLTNFGVSLDFSINSAGLSKQSKNRPKMPADPLAALNPEQSQQLDLLNRDRNAFVDFNIPWNLRTSYSYNYSKSGFVSNATNTLNFGGDFSVTPKWKMVYNSGYDFQQKKISLTQISIYRDLHCWDLSFSWIPFGTYRSYSVDLRVRASILQDLKLSKRRDYYNNF
ncbi:MAG: putative LPS assembly protein LptD [Sphingobacteriaceae bacterium]